MRLRALFAFACLPAALAGSAASAQQVRHPLDPLTWREYWTILDVLRAAGHLNDSTRFSTVALEEPPKAMVWQWRPGQPIPRSALAVVKQQAKTYEAVIDVASARLTRWTAIPGVQPNYLTEEIFGSTEIAMSNPEWQAAMRRRGITDFSYIDCYTVPPGIVARREWQGRRLGMVICQDSRGVRNTWPRVIEGLTAIVDLNTRAVLQVIDEGAAPVPTASADYDETAVPPRPMATSITVSQPMGPSFRLDGNVVTWRDWSFHVRVDERVGLVLSTVRYQDGTRSRPVMYEGSLSEMFVPYMAPAMPWAASAFLDVGEYPTGGLAKPLDRDTDCPPNATYLDAVVAGDNGRPHVVPRSACIFERYAGDMAWRHHETDTESRPKRDLVVRMAAVVGNYDYIFDWAFQEDGTIAVSVGATGITEVAVTKARNATGTADDNGAASTSETAPDAYGRFVMDNVVAVNHDHYFNFRLDLDVDGMRNSFEQDLLEPKQLPAGSVRRSIWVREPTIAQREHDAMLDMDMRHPALWRVVNPGSRNHVGYATSYELAPMMNAMNLLSVDDPVHQRAQFTDHHLWVTPYAPDERYAAGMYPTLSAPGEGLPRWTEANRPIADTDVVLWYTLGMHHVVRSEDWPVMPVLWNGFQLRPFDFFDRNPALDLPKTP